MRSRCQLQLSVLTGSSRDQPSRTKLRNESCLTGGVSVCREAVLEVSRSELGRDCVGCAVAAKDPSSTLGGRDCVAGPVAVEDSRSAVSAHDSAVWWSVAAVPADCLSGTEEADDFSFLCMSFSVASVFAFAVRFAWSGRGQFRGRRNGDDRNAVSPAHIDRLADEAGAGGIFKHCNIFNSAGEIAEVSQLFNGQPQCIAFVNEERCAIQDKLNGGAVINEECGQCRAGTLTFICLAFAAAFAGTLLMAMCVGRAGGARLTQAAGRNKRGLVLAINGDQWGRHFYPHEAIGHGGRRNWPGFKHCDLQEHQVWKSESQESLSVSSVSSSRRSQRVSSAGRISWNGRILLVSPEPSRTKAQARAHSGQTVISVSGTNARACLRSPQWEQSRAI